MCHSFIFRGKLVTLLLILLGVCLLVLHHAVELLPPLWVAGLEEDRRYDGELRSAYHRERRRLHRDLHAAVDRFFGTYDLLVTVVGVTEAGSEGESEAGGEGVLLEATVAATARMMCCPAAAVPIHGDNDDGGSARKAGLKRERGGSRCALVLIGRPYGDDAVLAGEQSERMILLLQNDGIVLLRNDFAAAAAWMAAHPAPDAALPVSLSVPGTAENKELSEGEAWCAGLSLGTRLVGSVLCGTGWARAWDVVGGGVGLVSGVVAKAYDRQRLSGYR